MIAGDQEPAERWEREIDEIVAGRTTSPVRVLGSVKEAFDAALASSAEPMAETRAFHRALAEVVRRWTPQPWAKPSPTALMLDLISGYTPHGGYEKTVGLIDCYGEREHVVPLPVDPRRTIDLHRRGLHVLASYFRCAPETASHGFDQYVTILRRHLDFERYRSHAVEHLLRVHALRLDDETIGDILDDHPTSLPELIRAVLKLEPHSTAQRAMSQLYAQCKKRPLLDDFAGVISTLGGKLSLEPEGAFVEVGQRHLILDFTPQQEAEAFAAAPALFKEIGRRGLRAVATDDLIDK